MVKLPKICRVCGQTLSGRNKNRTCFHHSIDTITQIENGIDIIEPREFGPPLAEGILAEVCRRFELQVDDLIQSDKRWSVVYARDILMCLLYRHTALSFVAVGDLIGNRDHATVMRAVKKVERLCKTDTRLQKDVQQILSSCGIL